MLIKGPKYADDKAHNVTMIVCMRDHEVFDEGAFNNATFNNLSLDLTSEESSLKSLSDLMAMATTEQLLQFTPNVEEILDACKLRQTLSGDVGLETFNGKECFRKLATVKFLSNTDVCFRFDFPYPQGIVWFNEVAFDPIESLVMRSITFNKKLFDKVTTFKIFFTLERSTISRELIRAVTADRGYDPTNNKTWYNHFGVRHSLVSSNEKQIHF